MIQANSLDKAYGAQTIFEGLSFLMSKGERLGLVGRNGTGKSTLFKMILGKEHADSGSISKPKGYKIGTLEQYIHFTKPTVLEECVQALPAEEEWDHYKAEMILSGLGFTEDDFKRDPNSFSGGYQVRMNLCKALLGSPDMLLLDEPTNYLDIISLRWLKGYLTTWPGEMMLITHDRDFMDKVTTHSMAIHRRQAKKVKGDTIKLYELIIQEEETYEQTRQNLEKKKKEMQALVDRFKAKASKAAMAQSRIKMMARIGTMDKLEDEKKLGFRFNYLKCPAKTLMNIENISFSYDGKPENNLFSDISLQIKRNDRIAIIGANGKGKSTLLNCLAGELTPNSGLITSHPETNIGHFGQTNIDRLDPKNRVVDEIQSSNPNLSLQAAHAICGAMMFDGDLGKKKVTVLSGGERSRVLLGKIISHPTNLLLLDEPTHHLDVESIESLTEELDSYQGALIIVTHSELLLRSLADSLIIFHRGKAEHFNGSYDDFLEKIGWEGEPVKKKKVEKQISKKEARKLRALERQQMAEAKPADDKEKGPKRGKNRK